MSRTLVKTILVIAIVKALLIFPLLLVAFIAWMSGADYILLPGLGLVVSVSGLVILLSAAEILLVAIIIFLRRRMAKTFLR